MAHRDQIELDEISFRELKYITDNEKAKTLVFGFVRQPKAANDLSRDSFKYPALFMKLMRFGEMYVGIPFTTIQIAINKKIKKIKNCDGDIFAVAYGRYSGGDVDISGQKLNIRNRPIIIQKDTEFSIEDAEGNCVRLLYYITSNHVDFPCKKRLSNYEGVNVDNEWKISYRELGVPVIFYDKSGFPKTYKPMKYVEEPALDEHQNLLPIHRLMAKAQEVSNPT